MAEKSKIPEGGDYREAWGALDRDGRRRVRRAVNRGEALESRSEARVAVALARSQLRFWRWGWAIGPVLVFALTIREGWEVALVNTGAVAVMVGLMAWFFGSRARRAAERNAEVVERARKSKGKGSQAKGGGKGQGGKAKGGGKGQGGKAKGGGKGQGGKGDQANGGEGRANDGRGDGAEGERGGED